MLKNTILYSLILAIHLIYASQQSSSNAQLASIDVVATKDGSQPLKNAQIEFTSQTGKTFSDVTDDKGLFNIKLPKTIPLEIYVVTITGKYNVGNINIPANVPGGKWNVEFNDDQMELANVFFDPGKYKLLPGSFEALDQMAEGMLKNPQYQFEIAGHTDNVGSASSNLELSLKRAQSVVDYLISKGADPKNLISKGYGETQPKADNSTAQGRELNRRIEARPIEK